MPFLIAAGLFDKVLVTDSISAADSKVNVLGILAPTIADFDLGYQRITYRVTFYSTAGSAFGVWEVDGEVSSETILPGKRARLAMRDAAAKFIKGFRKEPVVIRWLEDAGVKVSVPTEPQSKEGVPP